MKQYRLIYWFPCLFVRSREKNVNYLHPNICLSAIHLMEFGATAHEGGGQATKFSEGVFLTIMHVKMIYAITAIER